MTSRERLRDLERRTDRLEVFRALVLASLVTLAAYAVLACPGAVAGFLKTLAED